MYRKLSVQNLFPVKVGYPGNLNNNDKKYIFI